MKNGCAIIIIKEEACWVTGPFEETLNFELSNVSSSLDMINLRKRKILNSRSSILSEIKPSLNTKDEFKSHTL